MLWICSDLVFVMDSLTSKGCAVMSITLFLLLLTVQPNTALSGSCIYNKVFKPTSTSVGLNDFVLFMSMWIIFSFLLKWLHRPRTPYVHLSSKLCHDWFVASSVLYEQIVPSVSRKCKSDPCRPDSGCEYVFWWETDGVVSGEDRLRHHYRSIPIGRSPAVLWPVSDAQVWVKGLFRFIQIS